MKEESTVICGLCGTPSKINYQDNHADWYCDSCKRLIAVRSNYYPCCKICLSPIIPLLEFDGYLDGICSNPDCSSYYKNESQETMYHTYAVSAFFNYRISYAYSISMTTGEAEDLITISAQGRHQDMPMDIRPDTKLRFFFRQSVSGYLLKFLRDLKYKRLFLGWRDERSKYANM